jgi:hypothetical protein
VPIQNEKYAIEHGPGRYMAVTAAPGGGRLGGGSREPSEQDETLLFPTDLIEDGLRGEASDFYWADIVGRALAPDLMPGDRVLIDRRAIEPIQPGFFAVDEGIGLTGRVVEYIPGSEPRRYRIRSNDQRALPYDVDANKIDILGRIVWMSRSL